MVKLNLLDKEEGIDLDYTIVLGTKSSTSQSMEAMVTQNGNQFEINGNAIFTSREDREMLSIGLRINKDITLGEKEILNTLIPLLDELHEGAIVERIILFEWVKD